MLNSLMMEDEKLLFRHVIVYGFQKGLSILIATKYIQGVYLDRAPSDRTVEN